MFLSVGQGGRERPQKALQAADCSANCNFVFPDLGVSHRSHSSQYIFLFSGRGNSRRRPAQHREGEVWGRTEGNSPPNRPEPGHFSPELLTESRPLYISCPPAAKTGLWSDVQGSLLGHHLGIHTSA